MKKRRRYEKNTEQAPKLQLRLNGKTMVTLKDQEVSKIWETKQSIAKKQEEAKKKRERKGKRT